MFSYIKEKELSVQNLEDYSKIGYELVSTHNVPLSDSIYYILKRPLSYEVDKSLERSILNKIENSRVIF